MARENLSQMVPVVGAKISAHAASSATVTATTETIDMSKFGRVVFVLHYGSHGTGGSAALTIQKGTATGSISTSVQAVTISTANKTKVYEVDQTALGASYRYVNGKLVHANGSVTSSGAAVIALADIAAYGPGSDSDIAGVSSIGVE